MLDKDTFNDFADHARDAIDNSPLRDLRANAKAIAQSVFQKMELVSADDFDGAQTMLRHVCERLADLEARIDRLERALGDAPRAAAADAADAPAAASDPGDSATVHRPNA